MTGPAENPILEHVDLFHTGVVVDDLAAAQQEAGEQLGLTWHEGGAEVRLITDAGARSVRTRYALSRQGPHHLELCQSIPGTLWTTEAPGHAHHTGYWVDDVRSTSADLLAAGSLHIASIAVADDAAPICAYHRTRSGLYVEIVARAMQRILLPPG